MRFLSLSLPFLATDRIDRLMRAQGLRKSPDAPLATVIKIKGAQRLAAVDRRAKALGLRAGMTLTDARAMHPSLVCADADARAEAQTLENIADWCRRFTPLAALDAPDGVMLDVSGAAHLFSGEAKLLAEVEARLEDQGFGTCAAIASTPEAAWALARYGALRILPPNLDQKQLARRLGDLPLAALRLDAATLADLAQMGLRRISDIIMRPRAPITARFGPLLHARLDGLLGASKTAISPRFEAPAYLAERRFPEGILRGEDIEATIFSLALDLSSLLFRHDEGARRLEASLFRVDGMVKHFEVGTSQPLREPKAIARLFHECIERASAESGSDALDPGYGFDVIRLAALVVERQPPEQADWDTSQNDTADLVHLIDRLGARLGLRRVTRLAFNATHMPEFAITAVPAATLRNSASLTPPPFEAQTKDQADKAPHASALPSRPIRLLQRPEPIETIAGVPDGPPLWFRWRRVMHEVAAIEGPERIAPEWWNDKTALTRDYFRAEDSEGQRFWLFREGLFNDATARPRWFMHGLFA
jgi:protein ImuB